MGKGYSDIVKTVADYMVLRILIEELPKEKYFPLTNERGLNKSFYDDAAFDSLKKFTELYFNWYNELATNKRAFAPIHYDDKEHMGSWIKGLQLDAKDDSYYLLNMIKASNASSNEGHSNRFRFFLDFAHQSIDSFTKKIYR